MNLVYADAPLQVDHTTVTHGPAFFFVVHQPTVGSRT